MTLMQLLSSRRRKYYVKDNYGMHVFINRVPNSYNYREHTFSIEITTALEHNIYNGQIKDLANTIKACLRGKPSYYKLMGKGWQKFED